MDFLPYIYLIYMFISLYMLSFFLLIYFRNRKVFFHYPEPNKKYTVSFMVPAFNEEDTIEDTVKHIFNIDYDILEVIVVNDNSKDNTLNIVQRLQSKYQNLKIITNPQNLGKAGSLNRALEIAKGEIVVVVDADSYPSSDSLKKMLGYFNEERVGAVTCPVLVRNNEKFFAKLQSIEYIAISFGRKLLDYVDAIYVTPGPLAVYRKKALLDINGFDDTNLTEDIEATWHLAERNWHRRMSLATSVTTKVPTKLKAWWVQRRRWNVGGLQCIYKYRKSIGKNNMLGFFIIPFFIINLFLGLVGLSLFFYLASIRIISTFLLTRYSIVTNTPILTVQDLYITPSILNYLGIVLFIFGFIYIILILSILKERILKKENILNIPFYLIVYLILYPFIMVNAIWHAYRGKKIWR